MVLEAQSCQQAQVNEDMRGELTVPPPGTLRYRGARTVPRVSDHLDGVCLAVPVIPRLLAEGDILAGEAVKLAPSG